MKATNLLLSGLVAGALMLGGSGCKRPVKNADVVPPGEGGLPSLGPGIDESRLGEGLPVGERGSGVPLTGVLETASGDLYYCDEIGRIIGMKTRWGSWGEDLEGNSLGGETPNVLFAFDSAQIEPSERAKIEAVAGLTEDETYKTVGLVLEGHCDDRGTEEYNLSLGERRSLSVRDQLVGLAVESGRMTTVSFGEAYPVEPGQTEESWRKNRRVVFVVTQ